jgi:hypothetical protein
MAWQYILPEVTVKGFKKCCTSITMDKTEWQKRMRILGVIVWKM